MKKRTLNLILSVVFLAAVIIGFYTVWKNSSTASTEDTSAYITLDIDGVKQNAENLIEGKANNANIPLSTPTTKLGKTNPFANPE